MTQTASQIVNVSPLHQFKAFVAGELASKHGWGGAASWELLSKFNDTVESFWANGAPVADVAGFVNEMQMTAPVKPVRFPTRAGLKAAGVTFQIA